jgi:hypothetical protein
MTRTFTPATTSLNIYPILQSQHTHANSPYHTCPAALKLQEATPASSSDFDYFNSQDRPLLAITYTYSYSFTSNNHLCAADIQATVGTQSKSGCQDNTASWENINTIQDYGMFLDRATLEYERAGVRCADG